MSPSVLPRRTVVGVLTVIVASALIAGCRPTPGSPPPADPTGSASPATSAPVPPPSTPPSPATSAPASPRPPATVGGTLRVQGNKLVDTCGKPLVVRGVEQFVGNWLMIGGSASGAVREIGRTGANAVRILPDVGAMTVEQIDTVITAATDARMVVYVSPGDRNWFRKPAVKTMLDKHKKWLVIDAYQEPEHDDVARWEIDAKAAVKLVRDEGYTVPVTVLAPRYGRDLPALLAGGAAVAASDPVGNTVLGWQAYWGKSGYYQDTYATTLVQGVQRAAAAKFPVQIGIDHFADNGDEMDYAAVMSEADKLGVGYLWWDWYNPGGQRDNLSKDGTAANLFPATSGVVAALRSASKACGT